MISANSPFYCHHRRCWWRGLGFATDCLRPSVFFLSPFFSSASALLQAAANQTNSLRNRNKQKNKRRSCTVVFFPVRSAAANEKSAYSSLSRTSSDRGTFVCCVLSLSLSLPWIPVFIFLFIADYSCCH